MGTSLPFVLFCLHRSKLALLGVIKEPVLPTIFSRRSIVSRDFIEKLSETTDPADRDTMMWLEQLESHAQPIPGG